MSEVGRGSCVGDVHDNTHQGRETDARCGPGSGAHAGAGAARILDRATKQLARIQASRQAGPNVLFKAGLAMGWRPAKTVPVSCRPYLSVTAAATNFSASGAARACAMAAHQSGNVAGRCKHAARRVIGLEPLLHSRPSHHSFQLVASCRHRRKVAATLDNLPPDPIGPTAEADYPRNSSYCFPADAAVTDTFEAGRPPRTAVNQ